MFDRNIKATFMSIRQDIALAARHSAVCINSVSGLPNSRFRQEPETLSFIASPPNNERGDVTCSRDLQEMGYLCAAME